jgi:hypothetical protein
VVDGERGVRSGQEAEEVSAEGLDCTFSNIGAFLVGGNELVGNLFGLKVGE